MQGTLSQISLTDVLQLCILTKKSGLLKLTRGKETVEIHFLGGEVAHAVSPLGEGEKAFFHPLTWNEGEFVLIKDSAVSKKTVTRPTRELLGEWLGIARELEQIQETIPSENAVFRIAEADLQFSGTLTLTAEQWKVLSRIDGSRSVKAVAEAVRLAYFDTAKIICALRKERLLELSSGGATKSPPSEVHKAAVDTVPQGFFDRMVHGLAEVSGPIASVVVRDQIAALGATEESFPKSRIPELVDSVSQVIPDKRLKARFQQRMNEEMRALKVPAPSPQNFTL
ncbi:MAG TPA: DUF4388 domain-containing protein [Verrucomicrobiae bacterium]|jgi:uncharacterized protein DUF4388|nr:DUF4388 domain-containing protein [Verrucomicrobiae bacterium]